MINALSRTIPDGGDLRKVRAFCSVSVLLCVVAYSCLSPAAFASYQTTYTNRTHRYSMEIPTGYRIEPQMTNGADDALFLMRGARYALDISTAEPPPQYDQNNNRVEFQNTAESFRRFARQTAMGTCVRDGTVEGASCPRVVRESQLTTAGGMMAMEFYLFHVADREGRRSVRTVFGPVYVVNISSPARSEFLVIQPSSAEGSLVRREATPAVKRMMRSLVASIRSVR